MEGRASAHGRPQSTPLPAGIRIVDPAIHPLRVEAQGIRDSQNHELSVIQHEERLRAVAGVDRRVLTEPEDVELIDPGVVAGLCAA